MSDAEDAKTEIAALVGALTRVKVGRNGYTRLDRYRDFNRVFHGTPEGKRVLSQIIDICEGPIVNETDLANHPLLAARSWGRRTGALILAHASVPPPEDDPSQEAASPRQRR